MAFAPNTANDDLWGSFFEMSNPKLATRLSLLAPRYFTSFIAINDP